MMAQGIGVGFEDEMDAVNSDISNAINTEFNLDNQQQITNPYGSIMEEIRALLVALLNKENVLAVDGRELTRAISQYSDEFTMYSKRNNPLLGY